MTCTKPVRALCAACVAAVAVCAPTAAAGRRAVTATAPACATSGLVVWLNTQGSGAAGSVYYHVELTNLSGHACTIQGYPRVAAVSLTGVQLGDASQRFVSSKPLVTLAKGATASFVLQITNVENFPASRCRPVTAAGLRVRPPHQAVAKVVPFPFRACSRAHTGYLAAQAVQGHT